MNHKYDYEAQREWRDENEWEDRLASEARSMTVTVCCGLMFVVVCALTLNGVADWVAGL